MSGNVDFDQLLLSISKQHQQKSDFEVSLRQGEIKKKCLEEDLAVIQRKHEYLHARIPSLRTEVKSKQMEYGTLVDQLEKEKKMSINMEQSVVIANQKNEKERDEMMKEQEVDEEFVRVSELKYNENSAKLLELCETLGSN